MSKTFYRLIQGDNRVVLPTLEDNSIDCIVTDPQYGISFMGKDWDKALPDRVSFQECFRVLKHGGLAFVMSSPRQDVLWRMMALLEGVGFELRQSPIFWTYASGFPKAYDVGKGIDKRDGRRNSDFKELGVYLKQKRLEANLSTIQLGEYFKTSEERINHGGCITNWEKGYNVPTKSQWIILKEKLGLNAEYEFIIERVEAKREIIGKGGTVGDPTNWFKGEKREEYFIDKPETDLAKKWDGWKSITGLKPAVEVVLMVNKPREGSYVDNVLKHGVGAVNVKACRIPLSQNDDWMKAEYPHRTKGYAASSYKIDYPRKSMSNLKGRFPANLLVSDDCLDTGRIHKSGKIEPHHVLSKGDSQGYAFREVYGKYKKRTAEDMTTYGDSGGFSRFFSLDAWWLQRVKKLPKEVQKTFPFLVVPKTSKSERNEGLHRSFIFLESYLVDEAKCKEGNITQGEQLVRLLVDTERFQLKAIEGYGINNRNGIAWNTMLFGKNITEKYRKDLSLITKMAINSTTTSLISNWLTYLLTNDYMADVKSSTVNGGSLAGYVVRCNRLQVTTSELMASVLGVKNVASGTQLIINVKEEKERNIHSTVKPLKLMSYLVELGCPVGGVVLDPFVGQGTTLVSSFLMGKSCIAVEMDEEYCLIADTKMNYFTKQSTTQKGLFKTDYSFEVASS